MQRFGQASAAVGSLLAAVLLAACGSVSHKPPTSSAVISCLEHGGTGGRVHSGEVSNEIGGLPAHFMIEMAGFSKGFDIEEIRIAIFENESDGREAVERLEDEGIHPISVSNPTVVPVVSDGPLHEKNEALAKECSEI